MTNHITTTDKHTQDLERRIQYWIDEGKVEYDKERKARVQTTLNFLSKQYHDLTGKWYKENRKLGNISKNIGNRTLEKGKFS